MHLLPSQAIVLASKTFSLTMLHFFFYFFLINKKNVACDSPVQLSSEDLAEVEEALETMGVKQRRMMIEEQELSELKTELLDYQEDIEDFKKVPF